LPSIAFVPKEVTNITLVEEEDGERSSSPRRFQTGFFIDRIVDDAATAGISSGSAVIIIS
jgi:hypothetical protein